MKPMLAAKLDWSRVQYPGYVSPKIDGIRCIIANGQPMSRTWKVLPNRHLRGLVHPALEGLDGELIVGNPKHPNVFQASMSGIMSMSGTPDITYLVFDYLEDFDAPYRDRLASLKEREKEFPSWVKRLPQILCRDRESIEAAEAKCLVLGYEGVIVRAPDAPYKMGRSTAREGYLLKLKRYEDSEAVVFGYEELMHNENEAVIDVQGHTKRSSHKAGQVPGGVLGALQVHLLSNPNITFSIGSGFDFQQRNQFWQERDDLKGRIVKFKHLPHGSLDAPRFPIFLGFRHPIDLGEPNE